ncbi:MAG: hypothetical protein ABR549_11280, partial [Mycobacteriales bacterium]
PCIVEVLGDVVRAHIVGRVNSVLFASYLRTLVRERHVAPGPGPTVLLAGAVLWGSGILIGATMSLAVAAASNHGQDQVAQTLNVLSNASWLPFIAGIAVTLLGAALTVFRTGILPRWLGWVALVAGVVSLIGPGGFLGFFAGPLWLLVAGVVLAREPAVTDLADASRTVETEPPHNPVASP